MPISVLLHAHDMNVVLIVLYCTGIGKHFFVGNGLTFLLGNTANGSKYCNDTLLTVVQNIFAILKS